MKLFLVFFTISCMTIGCSTYNILVMLPSSIWSHYMQMDPLFLALAARGHNITAVTPFPPKKETPNFKHVFLESATLKKFLADTKWSEFAVKDDDWMFKLQLLKQFSDLLLPEVLSSAVFQDLVRGVNKFDLIFTEVFFGQEALVVLGHIFSAPVVTFNAFGYSPEILRFAGALNGFSYLPHKLMRYAGPMTFRQRLDNTLVQSTSVLYDEYYNYPIQDALISKYVPGAHPPISDMLRNISLVFTTANIAMDGAKLYPPNVVEISGLHFQNLLPLDEEIEKIMRNAKNGVIYFSLGSVLDTKNLRTKDIQTFLSVFKQLNQTVLWKASLNVSDMEIPANVHVREWFDQVSIIGHPNCVLFVTHGGISSVMEAIRYAVPMIGIPFFADQHHILSNAEYNGYAIRLLYTNLTQESFFWAITTVLMDSRFRDNINKASRVFTDKPASSLETAVYWIEYVIRHGGAHHLKPLAVHLAWYQLLLLDVTFTFTTIFLLLIFLVFKIIMLFTQFLRQKSIPVKTKAA